MDRPVTSKSRGVCRYYSTQRGCFAGDTCKFLHGADETLTPYDKSKVCRYYARGHCTRGAQCWFRHVLPKVAPDDERIQFIAELCCICLEKPNTYGLLTDCSHVFCLECIRQWRAPAGKSPDMVSSGTIKCCPLCRTASRFVTPSAHFYPNGSSHKKETIDAYKASTAKVPCKYFDETSRTGKPCCPFGVDCFYQHTNSDGTPHVFRHGAKHSMNIYRSHRLRGANFPPRFGYDDPIEFLQHIFENPITNLHATLDVIRASLPAFVERFGTSNGSEDHDTEEEGEIANDFIDSLELLGADLLTRDDGTTLLTADIEGDPAQSTPLSPEHAPLPPRAPLSPAETRSIPASRSQPARPSSRFSTVMDIQSRQTFIIDISDDEEEEEEEEPAQRPSNAGPYYSSDAPDSPLLESARVSHSSLDQQPSALQYFGNVDTDVSLGRPQCEHDMDPPFVTDGRGRVVWSSTRAPGRGTVAEGRMSRHSRTGSTPRIACPSPSSTLHVANARGYAWGGQDTEGTDEKAGGGESSDMG